MFGTIEFLLSAVPFLLIIGTLVLGYKVLCRLLDGWPNGPENEKEP